MKIPFQDDDGIWRGEVIPAEIVAAAGPGLPYLEAVITDASLAASQDQASGAVISPLFERGGNSHDDSDVIEVISGADVAALNILGDPESVIMLFVPALLIVRGVCLMNGSLNERGAFTVNLFGPPYDSSGVLDLAALDGPIVGLTELVDGTVALRCEAGTAITAGIFGPTTSAGTWGIGTNIPAFPKALCRLEITALAVPAPVTDVV